MPPDMAVIRNSRRHHIAFPRAPCRILGTHVAARPPAGKRIEASFAEHGQGDGDGERDETLHSK